MKALAIPRAVWATVGRRCWPTSRRRWFGLGLLVALIFAGGWWLHRWWTARPIRAVLPTGGLTWHEADRQAGAGRPVAISWPEAFSPDGTMLVISEPRGLTLWDAVDGQKRATWEIPKGRRAYQGAFSPDGRTFAALSSGGGRQSLMLDLIDVATGHVRVSLPLSGGGLVRGDSPSPPMVKTSA